MSEVKVRFTPGGGGPPDEDAAAEFGNDVATVINVEATAALAEQVKREVSSTTPVPVAEAKAAPVAVSAAMPAASATEDAEWASEFAADQGATVIDDRPLGAALEAQPKPTPRAITSSGAGASACPSCGVEVKVGYVRCPKCHHALVDEPIKRGGGTAVVGRTVPWTIVALCAIATLVIVVLASRDPAVRVLASWVDVEEVVDAEAAGDAGAAGAEAEAAEAEAAEAAPGERESGEPASGE